MYTHFSPSVFINAVAEREKFPSCFEKMNHCLPYYYTVRRSHRPYLLYAWEKEKEKPLFSFHPHHRNELRASLVRGFVHPVFNETCQFIHTHFVLSSFPQTDWLRKPASSSRSISMISKMMTRECELKEAQNLSCFISYSSLEERCESA